MHQAPEPIDDAPTRPSQTLPHRDLKEAQHQLPLPRPESQGDWRTDIGLLLDRSRDWTSNLLRVPVLVGLTVAILAGGALLLLAVRKPAPVVPVEASLPMADPTHVVAPTPTPALLLVHIAGAVRTPGVYTVVEGARIGDVAALAGGATGNADLERINLAAAVTDGQRVFLPRRGEQIPVVDASNQAPAAAENNAPLNLNQATADQLEQLPGVGPATAEAIVNHRNEYGAFVSVAALEEVPGIGPAKLSQIRDRVTVG